MTSSQELEQQVLGGIFNTPEMFMDIGTQLSAQDFDFETNQTLFGIITRAINQKEPLDKVVLKSKIHNLKMGIKDDINLDTYIDLISSYKPSSKNFKKSVKQLKLVSLKKGFAEVGKDITKKMLFGGDMEYEEIMKFVDEKIHKQASRIFNEDDTINLFDGLYDLIEERGNNPLKEIGYPTPFAEFNKAFGGCKMGNVYIWAARPASGKSTLLNGMAFDMSNQLASMTQAQVDELMDNLQSEGKSAKDAADFISTNYNVPALIIDTEMGEEDAVDVKFRLAAKLTGINPWEFSSGNWRNVPEYYDTIRNPNFAKRLKSYKLDYKFLPNADKNALISTIKKWYYTKVGRGNPCIVVYDYIKLSSGDGGGSMDKEHQVIGDKVNALKELMGKEVRGALLSAVQLNRQGEARSKGRNDDSSAIAQSDRILWFTTYAGIFRKKDIDEIQEEGLDNGSHKMIHLKARFQGKYGYNEYVKSHKGEVKYNFSNFNVKNFNVTEVGTAEQMYAKLDKSPKEKKPDAPSGSEF